MFQTTVSLFLAYLLGSIPSAVIYGKVIHGVDIREHGSGNSGATNSLRVLGKKAGISVLFIDIIKGVLAVCLPMIFNFTHELNFLMICGFMAVLGHILPVFASFRGGKGVATSFGVILALQPVGALAVLAVFVSTVYLSRYVSLASLLAAFSFLIYGLIFQNQKIPFLLTCFALFLLLLYTHRRNIGRLLKGVENKYPNR